MGTPTSSDSATPSDDAVEDVLAAAEKRDEAADLRDRAADRRDMTLRLDHFLHHGEDLYDLRDAKSDRVESKSDREASGEDRETLSSAVESARADESDRPA